MSKITGQYTKEEFNKMYDKASSKGISLIRGTAWIINSNTVNYYIKHNDESWTNYNCKTI